MVYCSSRCDFHTVCWDVVGCGWGTTSVNFAITCVCFIPRILPVFAVGLQYQHRFFCLRQKYHLRPIHANKILKKIHVGLKLEWGLRDKYWLSWKPLLFEVFFSCLFDVLLGVAFANMVVASQWPLERAPHLPGFVWYGDQEAHWSYLRYLI